MMPSNKAVIHRRSMKRRLQWRSMVMIPLSCILITSTISGRRSTDTSMRTFLTEAFLTPVSISRTPSRARAISSSTLMTDIPTQYSKSTPPSTSPSVRMENWNEFKFTATFSTSANLRSLSSNAATTAKHFEISGGGLRHPRRSFDNRYGGRTTTAGCTTVLDGSILISDSRKVVGRNGVLGFDVGLHMLPSHISLSSSSLSSSLSNKLEFANQYPTTHNNSLNNDVGLKMGMDNTRTINNPNSPIKKQVKSNLPSYESSYLSTDSFQTRNRMQTLTDISLLQKNGKQKYQRTTALIREQEDTAEKNNNRNTDATKKTNTVPAWFPYIPTRSQIQTLKLVQLKDACTERAIRKVSPVKYYTMILHQWRCEHIAQLHGVDIKLFEPDRTRTNSSARANAPSFPHVTCLGP